jgi:hypothetical protein
MSQQAPEPSGWATGGVLFAGVMMMIIGVFQAIAGIAAISSDEFYAVTQNYVFGMDLTGWGWIHLILGIVVVIGGYSVIAGKVWAGILAIVLASLSALANFFMIPYYPFWSILIIALCVWVIWSVTRPGVLQSSP